MVVIAVVGVLTTLLLPAVQVARETARRSQCIKNFKQLALARHNYESYVGVFTASCMLPPPGAGATAGRAASWIVPLLQYIEVQPMFNACNFGIGPVWTTDTPIGMADTTVVHSSLNILHCRSGSQTDRPRDPCAPTNYYGGSGVFAPVSGTIVPLLNTGALSSRRWERGSARSRSRRSPVVPPVRPRSAKS